MKDDDSDRGSGYRRARGRAQPARSGLSGAGVRVGAGAQAARRRHQLAAARGARAGRAGPARRRWRPRASPAASSRTSPSAASASGPSRAESRPATAGRRSRSTAACCSMLLLDAALERHRRRTASTSAITSPASTAKPVAACACSFEDRASRGRSVAERRRAAADRRRRHPFRGAARVLPERGPAALERRGDVARRGRGAAAPRRPHHDHGRPHAPEVRLLSDQRRGEPPGPAADQLRRRAALRQHRARGARGLEQARHASRTSCRRSRTGASAGSTRPR